MWEEGKKFSKKDFKNILKIDWWFSKTKIEKEIKWFLKKILKLEIKEIWLKIILKKMWLRKYDWFKKKCDWEDMIWKTF